ncbi:hypothetical protein N7456_000473 [Penicillium angulare]|uniref:Succinate dehydrogenase cytochrome b560 subunit n=1 Tax=Penicillium angulare TaxID=116970 RepID=A0A9W9GD32_9EURO|nr:hypothetical protein N7456_000473 [Penicillium angulare]
MLRISHRGIASPRKHLLAPNTGRLQNLSINTRPLTQPLHKSIQVFPKQCISTQKIPWESRHDRLAAQRLHRPTSPNLGIYKWTYVSFASALHRITGILLAGSLYAFGTLYLVSPAIGLNLDSTTLLAGFGALPFVVKTGIKLGLCMPFTFHAFNGVKHLIWDTGSLLGKTQSARATWVVLICSIGASMGLALYRFEDKTESDEK